MRRVILNMAMTFDGFFAGPNGELDWLTQTPDKEQNDDAVAFFNGLDGGFIGYPTAVGMIAYWANVANNPSASEGERAIAGAVNKLHGYLVSNKEEKPLSDNTELVLARSDKELSNVVTRIKRQAGKDLAVAAGIRTAQTFVRLGLVDEYVINVHPIAIGDGKRVFTNRVNLALTSEKTYKSGVIRLCYRPVN